MADINWNNIFNNYSNQYDKKTAIEYTVYGRLSGSKKLPGTRYSEDEWLDFEAPDYKAAITYSGDDALAKFTATELKNAKTFSQLLPIATKATNNKLLSASYSQVDYYNDLKSLWNQKTSAMKKYKAQESGAWWNNYGLPDPKQDFDPASTDPKKLYKPAEDYITAQTKAYEKKKGTAAAKDFNAALRTAVYNKLKDAGFTPFLVAAQQRIRARG